MEKLADGKTKAIVIINPNNPCGAVFTLEHMNRICDLARKLKIVILSDEIYSGIDYDETRPFYSYGNICEDVPIIVCGAISKVYGVPGWRLGWVLIYNRYGVLDDVLEGLTNVTQILLHPNTLVQYALHDILFDTPKSYYESYLKKAKELSKCALEQFANIKGITPLKAHGTVYMLVKIEPEQFSDIKDDLDFAKKLLKEQYILMLPGRVFNYENHLRITLGGNPETFVDARERLLKFCADHAKQ